MVVDGRKTDPELIVGKRQPSGRQAANGLSPSGKQAATKRSASGNQAVGKRQSSGRQVQTRGEDQISKRLNKDQARLKF